MAISARDGLVRQVKEERDEFAFQFGSLEMFLTEVRQERVVMNRDMKAYMSEFAGLGCCQKGDRLKAIESRLLKVRTKSKRISYQGRQLMSSMEKELWEMDIEIIRLSKRVFGETKDIPEQCRLPQPDCPQTPKQVTSAVTPSTSANIAHSDHVKVQIEPTQALAGPQETDSSVTVDSKKLPKNTSSLQESRTDLCTLLEERDRFGFELCQFEKILMEIRKNRISFNKQMKLLLTDIAALPKVTQGTRLNSLKTKVAICRNQSKRLSYEGRQLLEPMQNDLWDMDLQIIRANGHCNQGIRREVVPVQSCLPHPDGPPVTSNMPVAYKNSKVSDATNDIDVNIAMTSSTTSATAARPPRKRIAMIKTKRQTFCPKKELKRPVSAPCLYKLEKKRKGMMTVSSTSNGSSSTDKPAASGNQVLVRPTKRMTVETKTRKSPHGCASDIHVHLKQKTKVHSMATSAKSISHSTFVFDNTVPATQVQLGKKKKVPSAAISSERTFENLEPTMSSNQVCLTQVNSTAANARHISRQCTFRKTDHTVKLIQEEPMTAPTNPTQSFSSSDEMERKSYSASSQVRLTRNLNGTALKTQVRPQTSSALTSVAGGTRTPRKIGLEEAQTILEILKMQRDLLVTSIHGIRSELDLGKQEDCIWRSRMDELNTELRQIKRCPNRHREASIRAKAAYLKVQMSNLQLRGNVYLNSMDSVISHLTGEIRGVSCKIVTASPFNIEVNISGRCTN